MYLRTAIPTVFIIVFLGACASPSPQSSDGTMFRGDLQHSGTYDVAPIRTLHGVKWRFDTDGPLRSAPVVADNRLYVGSTDGMLYAIDKNTGQEIWRFDSGSAISASPAVAGGTLYFTTRDEAIIAVNARSGDERWRVETGPALDYEWGFDYYTSSPAVFNGTVFVGSGNGHVYALDGESGELRWRFETSGRVRSSPAAVEGVIYVGDVEGHLYALDAAEGRLQWRFDTDGASINPAEFGFDRKAIISSPSVTDELVLVGGRDGILYAVDRTTGTERWRMNHEISWAISSPAVAEGSVFSGTSDGRFVQAVDQETGREQWRVAVKGAVWSSPAYVRGLVYVGVSDGHVLALEAETGEEIWRFRTGDRVWATPVPEDGVVFIGSDDGSLYALSGMPADRSGEPPRRAVYWQKYDDGYEWFSPAAAETVRDYFKEAGYEVLDAAGLERFMIENTASRSVVVFASTRVPKALASDTSSAALLRTYLEEGGKVVWLGSGALAYTHDPVTGAFSGTDFTVAERILDIDFGGPDTRGHGGYYGATPTEDGRVWGFRKGWVSCCSVDPAGVTTVLARDERGSAAAWVKRFSGSDGSGLVQLWVDRTEPHDLAFVLQAAERGI